jgi:hypothetical protein
MLNVTSKSRFFLMAGIEKHLEIITASKTYKFKNLSVGKFRNEIYFDGLSPLQLNKILNIKLTS